MEKIILLFYFGLVSIATFSQSVTISPIDDELIKLDRNGASYQKFYFNNVYKAFVGSSTANDFYVSTFNNPTGKLLLATNSTPRMTILADGKIGIGNAAPGFLLNFADILGDKISLWGSSGNHYGFGIQSSLLQVHTDGSTSDVAFGYGTSAAFTETMRIKGNGKVGIGTPVPLSTLNVAGGNWDLATTNGDFAIGNSTYKLKFGVATGGGGAGDARIYTTGGTHRTIFGSNTLDIMAVTPTGVGVGTMTPSTGFQIAGTTSNQTELSLIAQNTNFTILSFNRSLGTLAAPTAIGSARNLGWINFNGYDGTSFQTSSSIRSLSTGAWTSTGRGSYLSFFTTNVGTTPMTERIRISDNGNVGIGTSTPANKLDVLGIIRANEVIVETGWADYVFKDDYQLKPLSEVEAFIKENKHLPSVPSAATIQEKGAHVAELMTKMMEKIEELTLYSIQQKKEIDELKKRLDEKK